MPSPFPGMDPYLENPDIWSDFHDTFLVRLRAELNQLLPEHYLARYDRHVWIDEPEGDQPRPLGRPDVFITDSLDREPGELKTSILTAPATAVLPAIDPQGKPFLKIIDTRGRRVVTVIEMLSPANKTRGRDGDAYLAKRQEYLRTGTNLVEIDFLRNGLRPPLLGERPAGQYYILVSRPGDYPRAGIWSLTIRDPLPTIPIPLGAEQEPIQFPLQPCLEHTYAEARFDEDVDYNQNPVPSLQGEDAVWARDLILRRRPAND